MELLLLLLVPFLIAFVGFLIGVFNKTPQYEITLKEFFAILGTVLVLVIPGYFIAKYSAMGDTEIWSGRVVKKQRETVSCCHAYPCHPHSCGKDSICWDICYEHLWDYDWVVYTNNGEEFDIDRIDRQGCGEPPRFTRVSIGDPTARAHSFTNYVKANPWSLFRREGYQKKFAIPKYPSKVYD